MNITKYSIPLEPQSDLSEYSFKKAMRLLNKNMKNVDLWMLYVHKDEFGLALSTLDNKNWVNVSWDADLKPYEWYIEAMELGVNKGDKNRRCRIYSLGA